MSRISSNFDSDIILSGLLKKMKDLGLFNHHRDDPLLNEFLRKISAIGYLPVFYVRQKFYQLTQSTNDRFLKNAYPHIHNFFSSFSISNIHGSPLSPRMCTMSLRTLLLYVQSTHARDITTDSMSDWEKE